MDEIKKFVVKDYMRPAPAVILCSVSLKEAVQAMTREKTNGLVVVDAKNRVSGILSSWDVIRYVVPNYLEEDKHLASFASNDLFAKRIQEVASHPVSKFMTQRVHTVLPTDSLMEAATLLSEHNIRQLPVVDANGVLVGYINRTDIKKAIYEVLGSEVEEV